MKYDQLAEMAIAMVFGDNLALFLFGDEDMSTVDELMHCEA